MLNKSIKHYGIPGMRWGHRKARTISDDSVKTRQLRRKGLANMSDKELETVIERLRLEKEYKTVTPLHLRKSVHSMSNTELVAGANRGKLFQHQWRYGLRSTKDIRQMSDDEVKKVLNRANLELRYRDVSGDKILAGQRFVEKLLNFDPNRQLTVSGFLNDPTNKKKKTN